MEGRGEGGGGKAKVLKFEQHEDLLLVLLRSLVAFPCFLLLSFCTVFFLGYVSFGCF